MNTIAHAVIAAAALLLPGSSPEPSDPIGTASVAYATPRLDVDRAALGMRRDMAVDAEEVPAALATMAECGKGGTMEFRGVATAVVELSGAWRSAFDRRAYGTVQRYGGVEDVSRLCRSLENARRMTGSDAGAVEVVRKALEGTTPADVFARTMINDSNPRVSAADFSSVERDYRERISRD